MLPYSWRCLFASHLLTLLLLFLDKTDKLSSRNNELIWTVKSTEPFNKAGGYKCTYEEKEMQWYKHLFGEFSARHFHQACQLWQVLSHILLMLLGYAEEVVGSQTTEWHPLDPLCSTLSTMLPASPPSHTCLQHPCLAALASLQNCLCSLTSVYLNHMKQTAASVAELCWYCRLNFAVWKLSNNQSNHCDCCHNSWVPDTL